MVSASFAWAQRAQHHPVQAAAAPPPQSGAPRADPPAAAARPAPHPQSLTPAPPSFPPSLNPQILEIGPDEFHVLSQQSDVPVLIDWFGKACGPCKMILPKLEQMAGEYEGRIVMKKIDAFAHKKEFAMGLGIKVRAWMGEGEPPNRPAAVPPQPPHATLDPPSRPNKRPTAPPPPPPQVLPTFHVWYKGEKVGEMTGSNEAKLRAFVEEHSAK